LRKESLTKQKLMSDMENFDLDNADCRSDFDRDFIHAGIVQWYGSKENFTSYVRGPLRNKLLGTAQFCIQMPFAYIFMIATPSLTVGLEGILSMWKAGIPFADLAGNLAAKVIGVNFLWQLASLKLALYLCDRFAISRLPRCFDWVQTLAIWLAYLGCYMIGVLLGTEAAKHSLALSLVWLAGNLTLVVVFYCMYRFYEKKTAKECSTACVWDGSMSNMMGHMMGNMK